jgi:ribosomal protein L37AE/L43A
MILAEAIRTARDADLVATAERLGIRLKTGKANERVGRCPACGDDRLSINVKQKAWRCGRCNRSGVAVDLVMRARGCSFREAVSFLSEAQ